MPASQPRGRRCIHRTAALAVLPGTMSRSWPRPTSTTLVAQALVRNRPRRPIRCSSRPSASVQPMRCVSASSSAPPQRRTDSFTGCQLQPNSSARSPSGRPSPPWRVAQRPALVVSFSRGGAIRGSCSVTVPAPQPRSGQRHRRLLHQPHRPAERRQVHQRHGRSPSDHNGPPQPPHAGLGARRCTCTRSGAPGASSTPSTSTSPSPTNNSRTHTHRVNFHRDPPNLGCLGSADSGGSLAFSRGPLPVPLRPQTRSA